MKKYLGVNKYVFWLGIVSFLTDLSSEMIFSIFSIFFTVILGASTVLLGLVEGLADAAAASLDYLSGYLSDKTGKRRVWAMVGYAFSTVAKSMLIFASTVLSASIFRVTERLGKSWRGAPRDAWIASLAEGERKGFSFGVHKAMDKVGAVLGPLIAFWLLSTGGETWATFKTIWIMALVPAALSVLILAFIPDQPVKPVERLSFWQAYRNLGPQYRSFIKISALFSLAYFSYGFLLLKAYAVGISAQYVVLLYALFNVAFVVVAPWFGELGDRWGRRTIIFLEYILYLLMCIGFIWASTPLAVILLFVVYGLFYAIDESQVKAYLTDLSATERGTALGFYNFLMGMVYFPASLLAGWLWSINPQLTFLFAGVVTLVAGSWFALTRWAK